tara:strand:- start:2364 stop:2828 length:465 start_codon:yes stop_codon:yes gene_type:complete
MMKNITIFDLDGTCIDSGHRQNTLPDGTLDISKWLENATPEKIFQDKLMPLAQQINKRAKAGDFTIVCTARIMTFADFEFLMNEGINPNMILSRKDGDMRPDGEMKLAKLKSLFNLKQFRDKNKIMFDDAASVRSTLRGLLDAVIDPLKINGRI